MRAVVLTGHGGNDVVHLAERSAPVARAGEVIVRMRSVTLNRADLYMRNSGKGVNHSLPQVMGLDGAGLVEEVFDDSCGLRVGQRVAIYPATSCGTCEACARGQEAGRFEGRENARSQAEARAEDSDRGKKEEAQPRHGSVSVIEPIGRREKRPART